MTDQSVKLEVPNIATVAAIDEVARRVAAIGPERKATFWNGTKGFVISLFAYVGGRFVSDHPTLTMLGNYAPYLMVAGSLALVVLDCYAQSDKKWCIKYGREMEGRFSQVDRFAVYDAGKGLWSRVVNYIFVFAYLLFLAVSVSLVLHTRGYF